MIIPKSQQKPIQVSWKNKELRGSTTHLQFRSVQMSDQSDYKTLYGDKNVVQLYLNGKPWNSEKVSKYLKLQTTRVKKGDPFHALRIGLHNNTFIGNAALGHGYFSGEAHLGFALLGKYQGKGFGKELAKFLVHGMATSLRGKKVNNKPFKIISATVDPKNKRSITCLKYAGLKKVTWPAKLKNPNNKLYFSVSMKEILSQYNNKNLR